MDPSFQNKVNLLAGLLVAFSLLAMPVFVQVKADTLESAKHAPDTVLSRFSRDLAEQFRPDDLSDLEVEDAWYRQAKEENPQCGIDCDPHGDPDGDGWTNEEELRNGTNPMCNEKEYGHEYCQGVDDKYNVTRPDDPDNPVGFSRVLYECEWGGANQNNLPESCSGFDTAGLRYDYFMVYLNASWNYNGYEFELTNEDGDIVYERSGPAGTPLVGGGQERDVADRVQGVLEGEFSAYYGYPGGTLFANGASVDVKVVGVIEPKRGG